MTYVATLLLVLTSIALTGWIVGTVHAQLTKEDEE